MNNEIQKMSIKDVRS